MPNDQTIPMKRIVEGLLDQAEDRVLFQVVCDGLDLAQKLWPDPPHATVTLETNDWIRLRRVLLALPDLWLRGNQ